MHVVMDIGCLECNEPTNLVAVVATLDEAIAIGATPREDMGDDYPNEWSGHHVLVAFELPNARNDRVVKP